MKKLTMTAGTALTLAVLMALTATPLEAAAPSIADCLGPDALVPEDERFCKRLLANVFLYSAPQLPERYETDGLTEFDQLSQPSSTFDAAPSVADCLGPDALVPEDKRFCKMLLRDLLLD